MAQPFASLAASPSKTNAQKRFNVVIIGCSYAGMSAAATLTALKDGLPIPFESYGDYSHLRNSPSIRNFNITMIDERDGFFHTVGAPLAHVAPSQTRAMWKSYRGFSKLNRLDITFIQGTVASLDCQNQEITYCDSEGASQKLPFDYVVISTGLRRRWPIVPRAKDSTSYVKDAFFYTETISRANRLGVVVVGGGAVGIEYAGKIKIHYRQTRVTLVHSRHQLLSNEPLPEEFKKKTLNLLRDEGVRVILGHRCTVDNLADGSFYVIFSDGNRVHAGMVIMATSGSNPATEFLPRSALNGNGSVNVDSQLRVASTAPTNRVFAAGDIVNHQSIKLGGTAMLMGSIAAANIFSMLLSTHDPSWPLTLESCPEIEPRMSLSVGENAIVFSGNDGEVRFGKELVELHFGSDLGWTRVLTALGLNDATNI